jgi:SAM-dependent methyltransferase
MCRTGADTDRHMTEQIDGSPRAEALLAATSTGTLSLLLGSGSDRLAAIIPRLGGIAVAAEWKPPTGRHTDGQGEKDDILRVSIDPYRGLPFVDGCFDSIFVPRALALTRLTAERQRSERELHGELIRECRRVLKPGGRLVASVPNAAGLRPLLRVMERLATGTPLLPRRLRDRVRKLAAVVPKSRGYSKPAAARLLQEGGFEGVTHYLPWPRRSHWKVLMPDAYARTQPLPAAGQWDRVTRLLLDALFRVGLQERLILEYCVVARRAGDGAVRSRAALMDEIMRQAVGTAVAHEPIVIHARSDRIATFISGSTFVKVAFGPVQARRFGWEVEALDRARSTAVHGAMIDYIGHGRIHSVPYMVFPAAEVVVYRDEAEKIAVLEQAFDVLGGGARSAELQATDAWRRIFADKSRQELTRLGARGILDRFTAACAGRKVPVGLVHGDLHVGNVLRRGGSPTPRDWDRLPAASPLLLDRCNAVTQLLVSRATAAEESAPRLKALERLAKKDQGTPLVHRLEEVAGELSWGELVAFYIVSLAGWAATQDITTLSPTAEQRIRQELAMCRSCLEG